MANLLSTMGGICAVAIAAAGTHAQSRGSVDQIGNSQPVGIQQVPGRPGAPVPSQLISPADSASPARQLTGERGSGPASQQLSIGARSAEPSQPLSAPKDGRTSAVERVAGSDRCDPAVADGSNVARCVAVIETRAAEFTRREPAPLSPEQRIIAEQRARAQSGSFSGAARRLAVNGDDAESIEAQGVASLVLGTPPPEPKRDPAAQDPAATEQLNAILNAIVNRPPGQ